MMSISHSDLMPIRTERSDAGHSQCEIVIDIGTGTDNLFHTERVRTTLRFAVTNLGNKVALYNFLSTFSGTHFVTPRAYQVAVGLVF